MGMNEMAISMWEKSVFDLIVRTSTDMPTDVESALGQARASEEPDSNAARALTAMLDNIGLAREKGQPVCQDTGALLFWVEAPPTVRPRVFREATESAIVRATDAGVLRQNCVDTLSGRNTGGNIGAGSPVIHWNENDSAEDATVRLILKGGGCENVGRQYELPCPDLEAGRDLEGVRRCLLHAVQQAQGRGCAPGVLGVAVGGDRATGYAESKRQLLRKLGQRSHDKALADLEDRVRNDANALGIGPMGYGGRTTVLDVFISALHRLPACYFVSVSYMCWAFRRRGCRLSRDGHLAAWL